MFVILVSIAAQGFVWLWLFLIVIQIVSGGIGYIAGKRFAANAPPRAEATGLVSGGILGLTAFVLALTLSFSTGRMAERRSGALEEANAIGTAWLQATALADPRAGNIADLLETYAQNRLDFANASFSAPELAVLSAEADSLQGRIWAEVTALLARRNDPHSVSLMNAINHVFDMTSAERLSLAGGIPPPLVSMLVAMVCASAGIAGFQMGLKKQWAPILFVVLFMVWSGVLVTVLDFGAARLGNFRTVVEPYVWTISGFSQPPS